jgi:paraquat-inducible protein B
MSKTSPRLIGIFVIGGALLIVAALVLFSSNDLFTPKRTFVAYFQQSVNGLNVGAPVRFRGIPVGEVTAIDGVYDPQSGNMIPRVTLQFLPETLENAMVEEGEYTLFPLLLERGIRASLRSASLLTGQLYVSMNFHPDEPARYLGGGSDPYPEMPTIDSKFDEAITKLTELPLEELIGRAAAALVAVESLLADPNVGRSMEALAELLENTDGGVSELRAVVHADARETLVETTRFLKTSRESVELIAGQVHEHSLVQVDRTLHELEQALAVVQQRLSPADPLSRELIAMLRAVSSAATSTGELADAIEENPEALLRGKPSQ